MRQIVFLTGLACAFALVYALGAWAQSGGDDTAAASADTKARDWRQVKARRLIATYRRQTWYWQRVMGARVTLSLRHAAAEPAARAAAWKRVATSTKRVALHPPHLRAWLCIHRYEGAWNDPNPPYYGGLQMDLGFQQSYGARMLARKGTADHWTPLEQMWVAERAWRAGRGFTAWPNTARVCGVW